MSIIFIETEENQTTEQFFISVNKKLQDKDMLRNAFIGRTKKIEKGLHLVYMRPSYIFFNLPKWLLKLMMKRGLKKAGYSGGVTFLKSEEGIKRLLKWAK